MKRSRINEIITEADAFIRSFGYLLPPFAYWSPAEMMDRRSEIGPILSAGLGWDVTDYGQGDFEALGLFLFTVRNGDPADLRQGRGKVYAEKIMISRQDQISPMHRHTIKTEDMPRMWVQSLKVETAKNADGQPGVSASGLIYIAGPEGAETMVEMALVDDRLEGVPSRDPRFRVTDNWAGQGQRVKPTKNVQSFRVSLFTPFDACQLKRGQQEISVYLRAFDKQGTYIGGTPPEPLQVNVP